MSIARLAHRLREGSADARGSEDLLVTLRRVEDILEYISLKLELYLATGVALSDTVGKAAEASRALGTLASTLPPQTATLLMEVDEALRGLADAHGIAPAGLEIAGAPRGIVDDEEVARILREAEAVARQRTKESLDL
ncbi:MAG: hypothetical protein GSR80_001792 [Desulfurococcales archaeon]|nr:hypothetical protein [Desulfurococcales archaeon]